MPITEQSERDVLGYALLALGGSLAGLAAVLGATALDHMTRAAAMCGPGAGHCLTCVGALACLVAASAIGGSGLFLLLPGHARVPARLSGFPRR